MISISTSDFIKINITNSKTDNIAFDIKLPKSMTVGELKNKLQIITGGNAGTMEVELYKGEQLVKTLTDDSIMLGALPIESGMRFHVKDDFCWDLGEEVEKFVLPESEYDQKQNTVRSFLKQNRMGKYNEEEQQREDEKRKEKEEFEKQKADLCTVGSRCQVTVKGCATRRGVVTVCQE